MVQIRTKPTNRYPPTSATKWMRKTPKKAIHPLVYEHDTVCAIGAVFFRRSRLFFREAAFSSGSEGCEWRAQRATVGESGDKAENEFSGFIPLVVPRKGFSPHIPAPRLFALFHTTQATKPHQIKQPLSKIAVNERAVYRPTPRCLPKISPNPNPKSTIFRNRGGANCAFSHRVFWISAKNSNFVYHTIHSNLKIDYAQQNDSRRSARH